MKSLINLYFDHVYVALVRGIWAVLCLFVINISSLHSQIRQDLPNAGTNMGPITKPYSFSPTVNTSKVAFMQRFTDSFQMNHSYEMTMGSMGGQVFNQNMYTNSMQFMVNNRLSARLDLGVAHSPFGNNLVGMQQGPQFMIRNAELNYQINDKMRFQFNFSQDPFFMNQSPWGNNGFGSPFNRQNNFGSQNGF